MPATLTLDTLHFLFCHASQATVTFMDVVKLFPRVHTLQLSNVVLSRDAGRYLEHVSSQNLHPLERYIVQYPRCRMEPFATPTAFTVNQLVLHELAPRGIARAMRIVTNSSVCLQKIHVTFRRRCRCTFVSAFIPETQSNRL